MRASNGLYFQIYRDLIKVFILEFVCCYLILACSIVYFQNFMILFPVMIFIVSFLVKTSMYSPILAYVTGRILINSDYKYEFTKKDYEDVMKLGMISSFISKNDRDKELIKRISERRY